MLRPSIFVLAVCAAQHLAGQTSFSRSYLLARPTHIRGSALTPDGGLVLCGWSSDGADSLAMGRGFLMRTDASGNVMWLHQQDGGVHPYGGGDMPYAHSTYNDVHACTDGSFVVAGSAFESFTVAGEFLMMGMDPFGDTLWTRFPGGAGMPPQDSYLDLAQANDSTVFISGYSTTGINQYTRVERVHTTDGHKSALSWLDVNDQGWASALAPTADSGCITAGFSNALLDQWSWVRRSDHDLNTAWTTVFNIDPNNAYGAPSGVQEAADGSILATLSGSPHTAPMEPIALVHLTAAGAINSVVTYALPGSADPADLRIRPNGKILVAGTGYSDLVGDSSYIFLLQVDPLGGVDWAWRYNGEPGDSLRLDAMELVSGTGDVYLVGSARTGRPLLIRTDSAGISGACSQQALNPVVGSTPWNAGPFLGQQSTIAATDFTGRFLPYDTSLYSLAHAQCGTPEWLYEATGTVFYDADGDGDMGPGEVGLPWYPVSIAPASASGYTNASGEYTYVTDVAGTYTVTPALPQQWWGVTSDSATYNPTFTITDTLFTDLDFGYDPVVDTTILVATANTTVNCAFPFDHRLRLRNLGTTTPQGHICYTYDASMQVTNTAPLFDSIVGQTIYWHYDSLWFGTLVEMDIRFELIPFTWNIGDTLTTQLTVLVDDGFGDLSVSEQNEHDRVITCSYDPNNKEVAQPAFIPVDQDWLTYTINFQNTGTDTAYTVRIEDQLSQHLQWNTLQYLGSSHDLTGLSIGPLGKAEFTFSNIQLPDSNVNEPASHGFITYRIAPQVGIPHLTPIENNAGIFFDLNAPVITNTTANRVVNCSDPGWTAGIYSFAADELWVAASPFNDTMSYGIQWFLDGVPVPGAIGVLFGSPTSGTYTASMIDEFGCTQVSAPYEVINVAVQETETAQLRAFPNPFNDATILLGRAVLDAEAVVQLIDLHGRVVRSLRGNGTREVLIERGALQSGLYMVRVLRNGEHMASTRLVVQ